MDTDEQPATATAMTTTTKTKLKFECNFVQDTCLHQFDGRCDSAFSSWGCLGGDCYDCDPCQRYNLNCSACITTSAYQCYYCPTDGICSSVPLNQSFWRLHHPHHVSTCQSTQQDWTQTCENDSSSTTVAATATDNSTTTTTTTTTTAVFSDPLYQTMAWSYQMINVESVWRQGITGNNIHVRINDIGIDVHHAEFQGRFDADRSCPDNTTTSSNSTSSDLEVDWSRMEHGTAVASILAANANNDQCAVGIAPGVTLSSCSFRPDISNQQLKDLLLYKIDSGGQVDISTNSWGPDSCVYLRRRRRRHRRHLRQQQHPTSSCWFDTTHQASPCDICGNVTDPHLDLSTTCERAIVGYCKAHYEHDPVACNAFLDLFVSCEYHVLPEEANEALELGVQQGRNGKGIVFVFAAGNSYERGAFTNADGFIDSRYTISVGAVGKEGRHASYSTPGSALLVTAPAGDEEFVTNNIVAKPGGGCQDITIGTSFAAPVVAGVVALMLEVNLDLGWRDVQGILVSTAQRTDPMDPFWTNNAAGLHHNVKYGFGIVDAAAAVEASRTWTNYGPEETLTVDSGSIQLPILDFPANANDNATTTATHTMTVMDSSSASVNRDLDQYIVIEVVEVFLDLSHASRGDLEIVLTSPSGTTSILHPSPRPENSQSQSSGGGRQDRWKLMTVRHWGERVTSGHWTLSMVDRKPGIRGTCANVPFEYVDYNNEQHHLFVYNCLAAARLYHCFRGEVQNEQAMQEFLDSTKQGKNGSAADACCVCGGGVNVTHENILRSWTMVIHGHHHWIETSNNGSPETTPFVPMDTTTNNAGSGSSVEHSGAPTTDSLRNNGDHDTESNDSDDSAEVPDTLAEADSSSSGHAERGLTRMIYSWLPFLFMFLFDSLQWLLFASSG